MARARRIPRMGFPCCPPTFGAGGQHLPGQNILGLRQVSGSTIPETDSREVPVHVSIQDLWKSYDRVQAARGVSFEIERGEIFGLLGPNGAGKTTTLECILGLRRPDRGEMSIAGVDALRHPRAMKQKIGAALQTTALQEKITPREALELFASFYQHHSDPDDLIVRFGLSDRADAPFDSLSGGQRQRLALALAFVNDPELVFLDEPTTGLDAQSRRDLHSDIRKMKEDERTVLLTTHYIEEAESLCDRVAIIHEGRIIAQGSPRDLIGASTAVPTIRLEASAELPAEAFEGVEDLDIRRNTARFRAKSVNRSLARIMKLLDEQGIDIVELHVEKASLEDVFLELTGSRLESLHQSRNDKEAAPTP